MKLLSKIFSRTKYLPLDSFFSKILYDDQLGYYNSKNPFGKKGDYITAPQISNLFNEIVAIWVIAFWNQIGRPKKFNLIELGAGDASFLQVALDVFKKFNKFNKSVNIFIYEKNHQLKKIQEKKLRKFKVTWLNDLRNLDRSPCLFFGNEFFDSIPIKQFSYKNKKLLEKFVLINNKKPKTIFKKSNQKYSKLFKKLDLLKNSGIIEYPQIGLDLLSQIAKTIKKNQGGLLLIDYGYTKNYYKNTIQSIYKHKNNKIFNNLGKADITSLVNFDLLKKFLQLKKLKINNTVSQSFFLQRMGIIERANIIAKKQKFSEQGNLYYRLKRILDKKYMGELFKVLFAYNYDKEINIGFQ